MPVQRETNGSETMERKQWEQMGNMPTLAKMFGIHVNQGNLADRKCPVPKMDHGSTPEMGPAMPIGLCGSEKKQLGCSPKNNY